MFSPNLSLTFPIALFLAAFLPTGIFPASAGAKEIEAPRFESAPMVDGDLGDAAWKKAAQGGDFVVLRSDGKPARQETKFFLGYADKGIYLAIQCAEPRMASLKSSAQNGDAVFQGDNLEIFIGPPNASTYYQLAFSPSGARFNSNGPAQPRLPLKDWKVATKHGRGAWTAEVFIPFALFSLDSPVKGPWRLNVARSISRPDAEQSLWSYELDNDPEGLLFHQPRNFAKMTLAGAAEWAGSQGEAVEALQEDFEGYRSGTMPTDAWQFHQYGEGEAGIDTERYHQGEHPDSPTGTSLRFMRKYEPSGSSAYRLFGPVSAKSTAKVVLSCAAMTTVEDSIFYPIVIGDWAAKLGFGKGGQIFYSQLGANQKEELIQVATYTPLQWYRFKVEVFPSKGTYAFYLDGKLIAESIPLVKEIDNWDRYFVSTGGGEGGDPEQVHYLDDVRAQIFPAGEAPTSDAAPPSIQNETPRLARARVDGFGEAVEYGKFDSIAKNDFPLGVSIALGTGGEMTNCRWRWLGSRESGRLDALGAFHEYRNLTLSFPEQGDYEMEVLFKNTGSQQAPAALLVRQGSVTAFERISPKFKGDQDQWVPWKRVTLAGEPVILAKPRGRSTAISGIRLVSRERKTVSEYRGERLLKLLQEGNDIYEEQSPEANARFLDGLFPELKKLNVRVIDVTAPTSLDGAEAVLKKAGEHGFKVILGIKHFCAARKEPLGPKQEALARETLAPIVERLRSHPALLAYRLHDEPFVEEIPVYRPIYQALRELDPAHPVVAYLCRASWDNEAASHRGPDNMKKWVEGVREEVLFNDLYPIRHPASESGSFLAHYEKCLEDDQRQAGGRPLWILAQAINFASTLRRPSPAEICVQAYLSLAHGARGLIYYNYNSRDNTLLDEQGRPNASAVEMGRVLKEMSELAPLFLTLQRMRVNADVPADFSLQGFQGADGARYLVVVNKDVTQTREIELTLPKFPFKDVSDARTGRPLNPLEKDGRAVVLLNLNPGGGQVLKLNL